MLMNVDEKSQGCTEYADTPLVNPPRKTSKLHKEPPNVQTSITIDKQGNHASVNQAMSSVKTNF